MLSRIVVVGLLCASCCYAGLSNYKSWPKYIGPKSQQDKNATYFNCKSWDTCPAETAAACDAKIWCNSFALEESAKALRAELYAADATQSYYNPAWSLWSAAGEAPPAPAPPGPGPAPPSLTMGPFECAIHQYAFEYSQTIVKSNPQAIHDGLNLGECKQFLEKNSERISNATTSTSGINSGIADAALTFYVSSTGSDTAAGTLAAPFATLHYARDAIRKARKAMEASLQASTPAAVLVRGGKYYFNETLTLTAEDSAVSYSAYNGEQVTLSAGKLLSGLKWQPDPSANGTGILVADVTLPKRKPAADTISSSSSPAHKWGAGPAVVNQLFIGGVRQVRARYPNGNPQDTSGMCFSKTQHANEACNWAAAAGGGASQPGGNPVSTIKGSLNRGDSPTKGCGKQCEDYGTFKTTIFSPPDGHPVYTKPMPGIGWQNNSLFSFWGNNLFGRPGELQLDTKEAARAKEWKDPSTGVVHMFHSGLWGGWMYGMNGEVTNGNTVGLGYGGYQEARGSGIKKGQHYYVENIREELDEAGEWFYDEDAQKMYVWPNVTGSMDGMGDVVVPLLDSIVRIEGTPSSSSSSSSSSSTDPMSKGDPTTASYATDISFTGFEFTETRATFLEQYEVPSGGDWSIHRGAAFFVTDAENVKVDSCSFNQTGGNGVFFSNHVTDSTVSNTEFVYIGDSAIALVGSTDLVDGTKPTYPNRNTVKNNHIHEVGIYGKQTSCFFQALAANTTLVDSVCYNGPRAGVNFNDGFGGGYLMKGNLVFNQVRETGDHGPFNSWDRQPYLTMNGVDDGYPASKKMGMGSASIVKAQSHIEKNLIINGYNGVWAIDHDDGSQFYNDSSNVMVWGGCKNYRGHSKSCDHNTILFPGDRSHSGGGRKCQTDDNGIFADQYYHGNKCFEHGGDYYSFSRCSSSNVNTTTYQTANNSFYLNSSAAEAFGPPCGAKSFAEWQSWGQDLGSQVVETPDIDGIVAIAKQTLA